jgi:hypothetical protein
MYRVTVYFPDGGFTITIHKKAADAYGKFIEVQRTAARVAVEDNDSTRLSEIQLIEIIAKEANDTSPPVVCSAFKFAD